LQALQKDIYRAWKGDIESWRDLKDLEIAGSVPVIGKAYYWWFGRGAKKKVAREEKEMWQNLTDLRKIKNKLDSIKKMEDTPRRKAKIENYKSKHQEELRVLITAEAKKARYNIKKKLLEKTKDKKERQSIERDMIEIHGEFKTAYDSLRK